MEHRGCPRPLSALGRGPAHAPVDTTRAVAIARAGRTPAPDRPVAGSRATLVPMKLHAWLLPFTLALSTAPPTANLQPRGQTDYAEDVRYALDEIESRCGHFFELKGIDWRQVRREFNADAEDVESPEEHHRLLWRLLARLEDGHAAVEPLEAGEGIGFPEAPAQAPFGMFWCRSGKKILVKYAFGALKGGLVEPGWEVVKVDGEKASKWFEGCLERHLDLTSCSTEQHAEFSTMHWGLSGEEGSRVEVEFKTDKRKKKLRTLTLESVNPFNPGPVFFPEGSKHLADVAYARLPDDLGYLHLRRCKRDLVEQLDAALEGLGEVEGLVLDFRGNSGGYHFDELMQRLLPPGLEMSFAKAYTGAGPITFAGPVVAIVDAGVVSAAETMSGMLKEDGRAYLIGPTPTAGMSSSKEFIELPSGLFRLKVSVASNKGRFNGGRGIEGIGVVPHEIVEYDQEDLVEGVDTQIARAVELLSKHPDGRFPKGVVPYVPADFGVER